MRPNTQKHRSAKADTSKIEFKPGNMLYPLPAVIVSCGDYNDRSNLLTIAWTGTVCTNPPMVYISVRPERYSYPLIHDTREFVINLTTERMAYATDYCGVRSGRDHDKWKDCGLTPIPAKTVHCPMIAESPVNIECKVTQIQELGSHHMFLAEVTAVHVDARYMDDKNTFHLENAGLLAYSHGTYFNLGETLGSFGYSIRQKRGTVKSTDPGKNIRHQKKKGIGNHKRKPKTR
ncbi:MAG: flavin reductase family protein [Lachnospiraceae bacterium]|nr:flavin reductase family protein [Lachnospiraceae bacterium]